MLCDCADLLTFGKDIEKTVELFAESIRCIRSGTISTTLIESIKVKAYDQLTPIKYLAAVKKNDNIVFIEPYDQNIIGVICQTLKELDFNAYIFSKAAIVINIPPITREEKDKTATLLRKLAEEHKISIRNLRKNFRNKISKDELKNSDKEIQKVTDFGTKCIDELLEDKLISF